MRRTMVGWWVAAFVLALSAPAMAHVKTGTPVEFVPVAVAPAQLETVAAAARSTVVAATVVTPAPSLDAVGALVAAIAVAVTLIARRRRAVAVACMALLLLVAFESGVHSVHHLTDAPDSHCVVASASVHIGGVAIDTVAFERPPETITAVAVTPIGSPTARPAAADLGRAPPLA